MTNLIKISDRYLNLGRIRAIRDLAQTSKQNQLIIEFGAGEGESFTVTGQDADNLRTWLNSVAHDLTHLHLDNEA